MQGVKSIQTFIAEDTTCNILADLGSALLLLRSISVPVDLMSVSQEIHTLISSTGSLTLLNKLDPCIAFTQLAH